MMSLPLVNIQLITIGACMVASYIVALRPMNLEEWRGSDELCRTNGLLD